MKKRKSRGKGATFDKVLELLEEAGYKPSCLTCVTGYWLKADVFRWEVHLKINGYVYCCGCWYSMTEFLKEVKKQGGFEIVDCEIQPVSKES